MTEETAEHPARPRRKGRRVDTGPKIIEQPAPRAHRRAFEPTRVVSDDELEAIHQASLTLL
ncbi:MAG: hypothetical protein P8P20_13710, partial [Acidimicrobiales bacterium]|nr:hypothetical protein [Acidimicrobiales bacterium]